MVQEVMAEVQEEGREAPPMVMGTEVAVGRVVAAAVVLVVTAMDAHLGTTRDIVRVTATTKAIIRGIMQAISQAMVVVSKEERLADPAEDHVDVRL